MIILFKRKLISTSRLRGGSEMKLWHLSVFVFLLVAPTLLLAGGAAAQTPCDAADALFNAQLYDAALTNYTVLLQQNPNLTCALNGSLEVQRAQAINLYEQGLAYEKANQVDAAKAAYVGALKIDPNFSNATEALARMNGGILTLAYTLYTFLRPALEIIVVIAIVLLAFAFVILITIFKIRHWIKGLLRPSLDIGDFDKGATGLEINKGLRAMVQEKYIMLGHERGMRFNIVEGPSNNFQFPADVNVAPYFKFLSDLIDWLFPPYVITLSGYLHKPGIHGSGITVSLVVKRTKKILGSCTIWQNELDLETTPEKTEESIDPTSYYNLAEPAAIWVLFKLGNLDKKREFTMMGTNDWQSYANFKTGVRWSLEGKSEKAQPLFVESLGNDMKNWGTLYNLGRMEMREGQYQHALERLKMAKEKTIFDESDKPEKSKDFPRNRIWYLAAYSLALTYCYLIKRYESNLTKAMGETKKLRENIKSVHATQKKDKMVLESNHSMFEDETKPILDSIQIAIDDLQTAVKISQRQAEKTTHDLIDRIQESVDTIRGDVKAGQKNDEKLNLSNELNKIEEAINELKNELRKNKSAPFKFIMSQAEEEANNLVDTIKKAIGLPMAEQEAKKLVDTIREAIRPRQKNDDKELKEFLKMLYPLACIIYADTLLYVNKAERAREIIKDIEPSSLTYGGRYNLACYYSIVGEKTETEDDKRNAYTESLYHIGYTLERGGRIVEWANKDPDLEGVREDKETKEDFAKLIKKYAPQKKPHSSDLPLAGIAIIGEAYAKQLKEQGIVSQSDLILKADTTSSRKEVAKKLGISTQLLHRWALLADLMRIVGNTQNANLLEEAGVGSLKALQNVSDPSELADLLNEINKAMSLVSQTPSTETVRQWVQEAKKTELKVR
jgi:tetratricopeptide (TPR) repeat protein